MSYFRQRPGPPPRVTDVPPLPPIDLDTATDEEKRAWIKNAADAILKRGRLPADCYDLGREEPPHPLLEQ